MGIPLYVICCFSFATFNILSWHVSPWIYPVWDSLHFLDLIDYFLSHVREVFNYTLFKYFLRPFLFLFFFLELYISNVGGFNVFPEVPETVLNSFHSFFFILLLGSFSTILSSSSLIHSSDSVILLLIPSSVFFISVVMLFISVCLFFSSSRSLLNISCIFSFCASILFQRFCILFTIITLNSFSGRLPISSSFSLVGFYLAPSFVTYFFAISFFFL